MRLTADCPLLDPAVTARVLERLRKGVEDDERLGRLTEQERRILELLAEGLTNRQIAEKLYISERTAQTHVQHIPTKLGFSARAQIAAWVTAMPSPGRRVDQ